MLLLTGIWRGVRVIEWGDLENRYTRESITSSDLALSAKESIKNGGSDFTLKNKEEAVDKTDGKSRDALKGICHFYSETGTEGGYWAFQEERYIKKNVGRGYCKKCGKWLKKQDGAIRVERVYPIDEKFMRTGKLSERPDCPDNAHEEEIGDTWDYRELHVLEDGDRLTIYSKNNPNEIVWSGIIQLRQYPVFTESACGFWIHSDQQGADRETWARWFFGGYPAALVLV